MESRTTSIDRRMVQHIIPAVPGDVTEEVIKSHLGNRAHSHNLIRELLRTDPMLVDFEAFRAVLRRGATEFSDPGILEQVRSLGDQFANARMTTIPGGESFDEQRNRKVIKFRTDWHFKREERERLTIESSIASQVIYLPNLVEGSISCTYDKTEEEGGLCVADVLASLPKVSGIHWIVGNPPTVTRVLANHLKETEEYLLPGFYTWTTGEYQSKEYGLDRLVVGYFDADSVSVSSMEPGDWDGDSGLFVLGVPA